MLLFAKKLDGEGIEKNKINKWRKKIGKESFAEIWKW